MFRQRRIYGVLATVGGLVLLESLFLPWYGLELTVAGVEVGNSQSAWQTMSAMDVLLCVAALAAAAGGVALWHTARAAPLVLVAGAAGVGMSLLGLIDPPEARLSAARGDTVGVDLKLGPFLALAASGGVTYAAIRTAALPGGRAARRGEPDRSRPAPPPHPRPR